MNTFGVDENGIIITEVSLLKITTPFKQIVEAVKDEVLQAFGSDIDSIYLYGSVANGRAIEGKSDLDIILVFKEKASEELSKKVKDLEVRLTSEYQPILRDVGFATTYTADALSEQERLGGLCFLKHLCVCIYGNDITKDIPGFKPSKEVARGFNGDIDKSLTSYRTKLKEAVSEQEVKNLSQSIGKKIVRTGFSLVMPRTESWTTNMQKSCDTFTYYYPEKKVEMEKALVWSKEGLADATQVLQFLDTFGTWLTEEFDREILLK